LFGGSLNFHVIMTFIFLLQALVLLTATIIHKLHRCAKIKSNN